MTSALDYVNSGQQLGKLGQLVCNKILMDQKDQIQILFVQNR